MEQIVLIPDSLKKAVEYMSKVMFEVSGIDMTEMRRSRNNTNARAMIAYVLLEKGYTETQVGKALSKDHSTVHYYRDRMNDIFRLPCYEAERDLWNKFKNAI